jgi:Tfp pilus assembly protein PilV
MRSRNTAGDCRGIVLIDVLTAMVFVVLVLGMAQAWARAALFNQRSFETAAVADQEAALALTLLAREIRDSGGGVPPIAAASVDFLEVVADLNDDGDTSDSFERLRYAHRADRDQVTRASGAGNAQPFLDHVPAAGWSLSFWTAAGDEIAVPPALDAAELAQVRRIDVRLRTEVPHPDPRVPVPIVAEVTTSVALRNR